jgi:hypothetical protein
LSKNINISNDCKGCLYISPSDGIICKIHSSELFKNVTEVCPCSNCLIKGICKDACKLFINYLCIGLSTQIEPRRLKLMENRLKMRSKFFYGLQKKEVILEAESTLYRFSPYGIPSSRSLDLNLLYICKDWDGY